EILRHAHHGIVDRAVAMGMVLTHDVTDDAGRLAVRPVPVVAQLLHRIEDPAMNRRQAVANVRERAGDDHAQGVVEVGAAHLLLDRDGGLATARSPAAASRRNQPTTIIAIAMTACFRLFESRGAFLVDVAQIQTRMCRYKKEGSAKEGELSQTSKFRRCEQTGSCPAGQERPLSKRKPSRRCPGGSGRIVAALEQRLGLLKG